MSDDQDGTCSLAKISSILHGPELSMQRQKTVLYLDTLRCKKHGLFISSDNYTNAFRRGGTREDWSLLCMSLHYFFTPHASTVDVISCSSSRWVYIQRF